ncbi:hypothetical protein [Shinella sp.]|uniref:hypothetical protein n=1 Tax=Shinella sp. TaxID=1870904 RepID=UPI003F727D4C
MLIAYVLIGLVIAIIGYRSLQPSTWVESIAVIAGGALWPATLLFMAFAPD